MSESYNVLVRPCKDMNLIHFLICFFFALTENTIFLEVDGTWAESSALPTDFFSRYLVSFFTFYFPNCHIKQFFLQYTNSNNSDRKKCLKKGSILFREIILLLCIKHFEWLHKFEENSQIVNRLKFWDPCTKIYWDPIISC